MIDAPLDPSTVLRLRESVREDLEQKFGELCVSRGALTEEQVRRGLEERERLRVRGEELSLL